MIVLAIFPSRWAFAEKEKLCVLVTPEFVFY